MKNAINQMDFYLVVKSQLEVVKNQLEVVKSQLEGVKYQLEGVTLNKVVLQAN